MLLEFRFNQLRPRKVPEYEARFQQVLDDRMRLSPLAGYWYTDVGTIDMVLELWPYEDAAHREQVLDEAAFLPGWRALETCELHLSQECRVVAPAPFSPPLVSGDHGSIYELRIYEYEAGAIPRVLERWSRKVPERTKLSPLILCGHDSSGPLHHWFHLWAYENVSERQRIRAEAVESGVWPPEPAGGLIRQRNMLLVPGRFSPLR